MSSTCDGQCLSLKSEADGRWHVEGNLTIIEDHRLEQLLASTLTLVWQAESTGSCSLHLS